MIENGFDAVIRFLEKIKEQSIPYFRMLIRFLALPYAFFYLINWSECKISKIKVIKDLLYIFFRLKYFPYNYSPCRLWEKDRSEWKYYYGSIYEPFQRARLRQEVQKKEYEIIFQDKYVCYQMCKVAGLPLPKQYAYFDQCDDYKSIIRTIADNSPLKKYIIKPVLGKAGLGISVVWREKNEIVLKQGEKIFSLDSINIKSPHIIQEFFVQHDSLNKIYPNSVNTIRIVTLFTKEKKVVIIGAYMRFGLNQSLVDNVSQGGISPGINLESGTLMNYAINANGKKYLNHPTTNFPFLSFKIPYWNDIIDLAKRTQNNFSYYKLLGQDIAVGNNGPVLIEINSSHDNVGLEMCCGPILKNKNIRNEFKKYNLLIISINEDKQ